MVSFRNAAQGSEEQPQLRNNHVQRASILTPAGRGLLGRGALALYLLSHALPLSPRISLALLGLVTALLLNSERPAPPSQALRTAFAAGLIFLGLSLVSSLMGADPKRSLTLDLSLLPPAVLFYLAVTRLRTRDLAWMLAALQALLALFCLHFLGTAWTHPGDSPTDWMRQAGIPWFSVPNDLLCLAVVSPITAVLLLQQSRYWAKVAAIALLGTILATLVTYRTRSGIALYLLGVGLCLLRNRSSYILLGGVSLSTLLVLGIDAWQGFPLLHKFAHLDTLGTRLPLWQAAWEMFLEAPWLGQGPGAFSVRYEAYLTHSSLPSWIPSDPRHAPWAHSLYLEVLAERGLAGLTALFVLLGIIWKTLYRHLHGSPARVQRYPQGLAVSGLLILLGGLGEFSLLRYWFLEMMALLAACIFLLDDLTPRREGT